MAIAGDRAGGQRAAAGGDRAFLEHPGPEPGQRGRRRQGQPQQPQALSPPTTASGVSLLIGQARVQRLVPGDRPGPDHADQRVAGQRVGHRRQHPDRQAPPARRGRDRVHEHRRADRGDVQHPGPDRPPAMQRQRDAQAGEHQRGRVRDRGLQARDHDGQPPGGVDHPVLGGETHHGRRRGQHAQPGQRRSAARPPTGPCPTCPGGSAAGAPAGRAGTPVKSRSGPMPRRPATFSLRVRSAAVCVLLATARPTGPGSAQPGSRSLSPGTARRRSRPAGPPAPAAARRSPTPGDPLRQHGRRRRRDRAERHIPPRAQPATASSHPSRPVAGITPAAAQRRQAISGRPSRAARSASRSPPPAGPGQQPAGEVRRDPLAHRPGRRTTRPGRTRHRTGSGRRPCGTPSRSPAAGRRTRLPAASRSGAGAGRSLCPRVERRVPGRCPRTAPSPTGRVPPVVPAHHLAVTGQAPLASAARALAATGSSRPLTRHQDLLLSTLSQSALSTSYCQTRIPSGPVWCTRRQSGQGTGRRADNGRLVGPARLHAGGRRPPGRDPQRPVPAGQPAALLRGADAQVRGVDHRRAQRRPRAEDRGPRATPTRARAPSSGIRCPSPARLPGDQPSEAFRAVMAEIRSLHDDLDRFDERLSRLERLVPPTTD